LPSDPTCAAANFGYVSDRYRSADMSEQRVETIDIFRGIAILLVVLFHFTARLPAASLNITDGAPIPVSFGWVGVYFFFVISGYCIFLTLERSATVSLFLARRISRIYPAFVAAVVLLFVFQLAAFVPSVPEANYREAAAGPLDVLLNLLFLGEIGEWVNGSFWSIAAEVKFYALIALMAVLIADRVRLTAVFTWLSLVMASIWAVALWIQPDSTGPLSGQSLLKFLAIAPYLPFFALGILGRQRLLGRMPTTAYLVATAIVSAEVIWLMSYVGGPAADIVGPSINTAIFLGLLGLFLRFTNGKDLPHVPLVSPLFARIGLLSYSWYLLHETLGHSMLSALNPIMPAYVALAVTMGATLAISWGFASLFEWRFRKAVETLVLRAMALRLPPRSRAAPSLLP
jgi:peptidoglycan/LPS O-acetylase OafA/YrhL